MSTKICNNCGRELDLSCFKNKNGKPYYICKECERKYMLSYRKLRREHINKQHIEYMNKYKQDDHITGKFRGVLCHSCNLALGHLHDNPEIIYKLLNYLRERGK